MDVSELIQHFDRIVTHTQQLCGSFSAQHNPHWLPLSEDEQQHNISPLQKACSIYQDYWYQDGQDGRETRSCFGLIAASAQQIQLAQGINQAKEHFKQQVKQLQKCHQPEWRALKGTLASRHPSIRDSLHLSGLSRLHLKQTWRHIPVIDRTPSRVGFNWYNSGRSIQKISVQQAHDALLRLDTASTHIQSQLQQLAQLNANTPLAKVQNLAPTMRANLFYEDQQSPERQAMNVSLPILFKPSEQQALPPHNEPELQPPLTRKRAVRSDRTIEEQPFLPSIRVHRYNR
ncbi:MAG: DNA replication terminus site-binding protein [Bermanella sp.]